MKLRVLIYQSVNVKCQLSMPNADLQQLKHLGKQTIKSISKEVDHIFERVSYIFSSARLYMVLAFIHIHTQVYRLLMNSRMQPISKSYLLMSSLLLIGLIKGVSANYSATSAPSEYFQTCIQDDKSALPQNNIGYYAYIITFGVLFNTILSIDRTRLLKQKFQQKKISYLCLVTCLYWEVATTVLFANILQDQSVIFQMLGKLSMVYPIFNLVWKLCTVDQDNILTLEKMASLLFQLFTIASFWVEIYWPFRIIFTSYSLLPLVQAIYRKYNKNAEKWNYFLSNQYKNVMWSVLTNVYFQTVNKPYMLGYLIIQLVYLLLQFAFLEIPEIPKMIGCMIKRYLLSLQRWLDKRHGRLLPNSQVCAICLQEKDAYAVVEEGLQWPQIRDAEESSLVRTSCGHMFHSTCMRKWMETNHLFCPMDYTKIPIQLK